MLRHPSIKGVWEEVDAMAGKTKKGAKKSTKKTSKK